MPSIFEVASSRLLRRFSPGVGELGRHRAEQVAVKPAAQLIARDLRPYDVKRYLDLIAGIGVIPELLGLTDVKLAADYLVRDLDFPSSE